MSNSYSLTVINDSELPVGTKFALFTTLPVDSSYDTLSLAWLVQQIDPGNMYTFTWQIEWGFVWSATGAKADFLWTASGSLPADPTEATGCAATFDYDGDFTLTAQEQTPAQGEDELWISDTSNIPDPDTQASSVGVSLNGSPACATNAGPNLNQTFTLHPTYYINAGTYEPGQMVDGDSVTRYQQLEFQGLTTALTATLSKDNVWTVQPTSDVNIAKVLAGTAAKR